VTQTRAGVSFPRKREPSPPPARGLAGEPSPPTRGQARWRPALDARRRGRDTNARRSVVPAKAGTQRTREPSPRREGKPAGVPPWTPADAGVTQTRQSVIPAKAGTSARGNPAHAGTQPPTRGQTHSRPALDARRRGRDTNAQKQAPYPDRARSAPQAKATRRRECRTRATLVSCDAAPHSGRRARARRSRPHPLRPGSLRPRRPRSGEPE